ncbi:MAG TPA: pitrilysin family protein [Anaerolineaceae bacterium]|nr:pitrilysin family protein [Anaerolineaceae bacterium]
MSGFDWRALPGPEDTARFELSNGITLLVRSNFHSPSVLLSGYLNVGSHLDPLEKLGLAYFTSLSMMRGTQRRTFQQVFDALESVGASLGLGSSVHTTGFSGRALAEDLPLLLELFAETVRYPAFPARQVERLRSQILTGLQIRAQETEAVAALAFDEALFPDHPYGRPEDGYSETVRAIRRQDLCDFHTRYYGPHGMVVVLVGAVLPEVALEGLQHALGDWTNPLQPQAMEFPPVPPRKSGLRRHLPLAGKSQTDLILGTHGPQRKSPDYIPASLGNSVLGQFGMMGRIGGVVREQSGLAYDASTSLSAWIAGGSWEVGAGVNPANLQRAIDLILSELARFVREPVSWEELQDSQSNFIGRLPLSMESNMGVANALLNIERFGLGLDYYRLYPGLVAAVTPEIILATAQRYLDLEKLAIISSGPELA